MKNSAFDNFSEGTMDAVYEAYDFKQCQRSDGTIYGVPDTSDCAMKGAKEVKPNKGGEGGGAFNSGWFSDDTTTKGLSKLGTHALRDVMTHLAKDLGPKSKISPEELAKIKKVVELSYEQLVKIQKSEGKEPMTLTSILKAPALKRLGINADKANVSAGAKPTKEAIATARVKFIQDRLSREMSRDFTLENYTGDEENAKKASGIINGLVNAEIDREKLRGTSTFKSRNKIRDKGISNLNKIVTVSEARLADLEGQWLAENLKDEATAAKYVAKKEIDKLKRKKETRERTAADIKAEAEQRAQSLRRNAEKARRARTRSFWRVVEARKKRGARWEDL